MTSFLLMLVFALTLNFAAYTCYKNGFKRGYFNGYADGCERKWEEDPETAKMTEEELWDKYGRFSMLHKEKKGNGIQKD